MRTGSIVIAVGLFSTSMVAGLTPSEIYSQVSGSVARLSIETQSGDNFVASAFLVYNSRTAITSWHAVYDAKRVVATFSTGEQFEVTGIVDFNETADLAVLALPETGRQPLYIAAKDPVIGSWVYTIGAPRGYDGSIVEGLLSGVRTIDGCRMFQVSCPFSPGNSGGPIVNEEGHIFGVASWSKRNSQNLNFATPANEILALASSGEITPWSMLWPEEKPRESSQEKVSSKADQYDAFRKAFKTRSGKSVTMTISDGSTEETYSFIVP